MEEEKKVSLEVREWDESSMIYLGDKPIPSIYSNNVNIGFSNWDGWIQFSEMAGEKSGKMFLAPKVRVVMSLEHLKAFVQALQDSLSNFEKEFGEIKMYGRPKKSEPKE